MEPKLSPSPSPEMGGAHQQPELPKAPMEVSLPPSPETKNGGETHEIAPPPQAVAPGPMPQLPTLPAPQAVALPADDASTSTNPLLAADEEVIEKEWVDRAKKIVAQTKEDPYVQEKEVSKLQADYLKKRYGKEIKVTDE